MKKLYFLRHGKSDWDASYGADHERPLNSRGKQASKAVGNELRSKIERPDAVFCSTAIRTRQTWQIVAESAQWSDSCTHENELYLIDDHSLVEKIRKLDDGIASALFIGHQPTTASIASWITGESWIDVPTGTFLAIDLPVQSWRNLEAQTGSIMFRLLPRELAGGDQ